MQHDLYFLNALSMKNEDRGVQTDRKKIYVLHKQL